MMHGQKNINLFSVTSTFRLLLLREVVGRSLLCYGRNLPPYALSPLSIIFRFYLFFHLTFFTTEMVGVAN